MPKPKARACLLVLIAWQVPHGFSRGGHDDRVATSLARACRLPNVCKRVSPSGRGPSNQEQRSTAIPSEKEKDFSS